MEGLLALGLWDAVTDVLEPIAQEDLMPKRKPKHNVKREKVNWRVEDLDLVHNAHISSRRASLFVFEVDEAHFRQESQHEARFQDPQS